MASLGFFIYSIISSANNEFSYFPIWMPFIFLLWLLWLGLPISLTVYSLESQFAPSFFYPTVWLPKLSFIRIWSPQPSFYFSALAPSYLQRIHVTDLPGILYLSNHFYVFISFADIQWISKCGHNYFPNNTKLLFAFSYTFSYECTLNFPEATCCGVTTPFWGLMECVLVYTCLFTFLYFNF